MTKRVFKSLPRLLDTRGNIRWISLYNNEGLTWRYQKTYYDPIDITFTGEMINFTVKGYRLWEDPINHPEISKYYQSYKVSVHRKDIQDIYIYTPIYIVR